MLIETKLDFFNTDGKIREYCFLNQKPIDSISIEEEKKSFKRINVFSKKLADNLDWTRRLDYQNSEIDTTLFFKGRLIATNQDILGTCGAYHNHQYSSALIELHDSEKPKVVGYAVVLLEFAVPSKHINNLETYYLPKPILQCFHFNSYNELVSGLKKIEERGEFSTLSNHLL